MFPLLKLVGVSADSFNKVFRLSFDNDAVVALRIPCPVIGPHIERVIASEAATMTFIRECFADNEKMPKPPKVLAWNKSYSNPAGTPFIICEFVEGLPLQKRWFDIRGPPVKTTLLNVWEVETPLLHHVFSQNGSLYFVEDAASDPHCGLYDDSKQTPSSELSRALTAKYCIGPSVNREWWRGPYGHVPAYRGPCKAPRRCMLMLYSPILRAEYAVHA